MNNIDISHWEERTLTAAQVAKILSISVSSVYRKTGLGEIPKPKLVCGLTRWSGEALAVAIGKKPINTPTPVPAPVRSSVPSTYDGLSDWDIEAFKKLGL